jgi:HlyD family secretion protein
MKKLWYIVGTVAVLFLVWFFFIRGGSSAAEIEYRYEAVQKGELIRSTSATGVLVALTSVDVKSKAGGNVVHLAVEEGSVVKKGQLIAEIDPSDTQAAYEQAEADLTSAQAKAQQARVSYDLQKATSETQIADAQTALETAKVRLGRAELQAKRQPILSKSALQSAQAAYDSAREDQRKLQNVTVPQMRRDAKGGVAKAKADLDGAQADYTRQLELLKKGYVSQATVEKSASALESAKSAYNTAQQKADTLEADITAQLRSQVNAVERAAAALDESKASQSDVGIQKSNLEEARKAVRSAEIALNKAISDRRNNELRAEDIKSTGASIVRSRVSKDNAKVQLNSTTVVAPRDGVVTMKYLEEGTIIPPGMSTFAQGTSLVQLSDVSRMFADCTVGEVDISAVRVKMKVRIILEAYPGATLDGVVTRVSPAAITNNNMTTVKVRVEVDLGKADKKVKLLPGMNATCEFIQMAKESVLLLPQQALTRDGDKAFVKVKTKDLQKPELREVKLGAMGNDSIEIVSGLKEGEEVVVAEINLAEMRDVQKKMEEAQQGGGLTGGGPPRRPQQQARPTRGGNGGGGGGRPSGGGGR